MSAESEVLSLWHMGQYDTKHIADRLFMAEADVYRIVSRRGRPTRPQPAKLPFSGIERRRERSPRQTVAAAPNKPTHRCQYRLREGALYLHRSGKTTTHDTRLAWTGDAEKALACCAEAPLAKNMQMELIV